MKTDPGERITVPALLRRKTQGPKITALTAYDFTFAALLDAAGSDVLLVGDSLSSVIQGNENTLPVTIDEMIYHCRCVSRAVKHALVVGDMPFMSYQVSKARARDAAGRLLKEGQVSAVKLEGGLHIAATIRSLVDIDIPVMGHVGLTPQSYHRMGGHRVQGRHGQARHAAGSPERLLEDALAVEAAGAFALVIEGVPAELAAEITRRVAIPTIGIGAGPECDGQILVMHDLLGLNPGFRPRFVKQYANLAAEVERAVRGYTSEVQSGRFPDADHSFHDEHHDERREKMHLV